MTKVTIPQTSAELEELLNDPKQVGQIFGSVELRGEFLRAYAKNVLGHDPDLSAQMREQIQMGMADLAKSHGLGGVPPVDLSDGRPTVAGTWARKNALYNKAAPGAAVDKVWAKAGAATPIDRRQERTAFLRALSLQCGAMARLPEGEELLRQLGETEKIRNSFGTNVPSDGGFLVPESFRSDLLMVALEHSIIRQRATVIPMAGQRVNIPAVDSTTDASSVFGGVVCYWVDEGTAPTETSAKFQNAVLDAKKLMAYLTAPNELVADAPAFGGFLDAVLPQAIAFEEDYRFMQGLGAGEPLGFVNCPAAVIASAVSGQGANTIVVDNLAAMFARMLPSSLSNAIWIASIDTFPQLALLSVSGVIGNSTPVWMNNGVQGAPPVSIYGRPVYFTEKLPTLGTTGDINFVDPSFYLIGDRQTIQASASPHYAFNVDKTAYKIIERVDGRPWLQNAITPKNSGNTLSPFVQLSSTRT